MTAAAVAPSVFAEVTERPEGFALAGATLAAEVFRLDPAAPPETGTAEEMVALLEGEAVLVCGGTPHALIAGDGVLIPAGMPRHWQEGAALVYRVWRQ